MGAISSLSSPSATHDDLPEIDSEFNRSYDTFFSQSSDFQIGRFRRRFLNSKHDNENMHASSTSLPAVCNDEPISTIQSREAPLTFSAISFLHLQDNSQGLAGNIASSSQNSILNPNQHCSISFGNAKKQNFTPSRGIITVHPEPLSASGTHNGKSSNKMWAVDSSILRSDFKMLDKIPNFAPMVSQKFSSALDKVILPMGSKMSELTIFNNFQPLYGILNSYEKHFRGAASQILHEQEEISTLQGKVANDSHNLLLLVKTRSNGGSPSTLDSTTFHHALKTSDGKASVFYGIEEISCRIADLRRILFSCTDLLDNLLTEVSQLIEELDNKPGS